MAVRTFVKDPDDVLDYGHALTRWLDGDTVSASTWTVETGLTKDSDTFDDTSTTVWLSGGTEGTTYDLTNHVTTALGREKDFSFRVLIKSTIT